MVVLAEIRVRRVREPKTRERPVPNRWEPVGTGQLIKPKIRDRTGAGNNVSKGGNREANYQIWQGTLGPV